MFNNNSIVSIGIRPATLVDPSGHEIFSKPIARRLALTSSVRPGTASSSSAFPFPDLSEAESETGVSSDILRSCAKGFLAATINGKG